MLTVAILAGGLATRLGSLAHDKPKALLDVAGRPFIAWQLDMLAQQGVDEVVLCVQHMAHDIREYVRDGRAFGLKVGYSLDGDRPLGTGGALLRAITLLGRDFFVLYGDSYLSVDLAVLERAYRAQHLPALITVLRNEDRWDRSNVRMEDGRIVEYSKHARTPTMTYIDYGLSILSRRTLLDASSEAAFDLAELYERLAAQRRLGCFEVNERFYEIGSPAGLEETRRYFEGVQG
jgi:NDP-sugar pyrophosphorylase family protein